jgi:hypothetical protein
MPPPIMRCRLSFRSAALLVLVMCGSGAAAQERSLPERGPQASTAFSAKRRFVVRGLPAQGAASVARWAEDVAERVENALRLDLPFPRFEQIELVGRSASEGAGPGVLRAQGYVDGRLMQRVVLEDPESTDQEDVLEAVCWLLLNRLVIQRQSAEQRKARLGQAPDWLSTGLAQNLYPELRTRNARLLKPRWQEGEAGAAGAVVRKELLPQGRWPDKAEAAFLVGWLLSLPQAAVLLESAGGKPLDLPWLLGATDHGDERALSQAWDLWIAEEIGRAPMLGTISGERVGELKALLLLRTADYGAARAPGVPPVLEPAELVPYRREPWMQGMARQVVQRLDELAAGQAPEFAEVAGAYRSFFAGLGGAGAGPSAHASDRTLRQMLAEADRALVVLETLTRRRTAYVDGWAARAEVDGPADREAEAAGYDAKAVAEYLDRVEKELVPPATDGAGGS